MCVVDVRFAECESSPVVHWSASTGYFFRPENGQGSLHRRAVLNGGSKLVSCFVTGMLVGRYKDRLSAGLVLGLFFRPRNSTLSAGVHCGPASWLL